jgi:hypothetical protein
MRYVRLPGDVSEMNINMLNPSIFNLPKQELYANGVGLYHSYGFASMISHMFSVTPRRRKDYIIYDSKDVCHARYHHMVGEKISMPPFWPALNDIDALRRIEENIELLVFQYGHPILHATIGDDKGSIGSAEEINDVQKRIESMESNGFLVTNNRAVLEMIGANNSALRLESYLEHFFHRVLAGLWLSEVAIGVGNTSNRSTANVLDKLAQEKVVEIQHIISENMQMLLIELLQEAGASIDWILLPENIPSWEFHNIDLEGMIKKEQHVQVLWTSNMLTENEMRLELGREPMTDTEKKNTYVERVAIPLAQAKGELDPSGSGKQTVTPANQHGRKTSPSPSQNK